MISPILFIVFNRPETTKEVFESIRKARPTKLYIAADGPREFRHDEAILCNEVRKIIQNVDWSCEVKTLFREKNMGCKLGVSSAIEWFFQNETEGIILEDDVLPNPDFYLFCDNMLMRYRDDERVIMITGNNLLGSNVVSNEYYFSEFYSVWGWATWKRSWNTYDVAIKDWPNQQLISYLKHRFNSKLFKYYYSGFNLIRDNKIDTWDHQWTYNCIFNSGYCVVPRANLIKNIGVYGTHSPGMSENHFIDFGEINVEALVHPERVLVDFNADLVFSHKKIKNTSALRSITTDVLKTIGVFNLLKRIYHGKRLSAL
uniref:nucleotide-diphospho-sugar transferase n=2 Tax=Bacteroidota/Chlorobiota group TaxID=68336 RepID=UPI0040481839